MVLLDSIHYLSCSTKLLSSTCRQWKSISDVISTGLYFQSESRCWTLCQRSQTGRTACMDQWLWSVQSINQRCMILDSGRKLEELYKSENKYVPHIETWNLQFSSVLLEKSKIQPLFLMTADWAKSFYESTFLLEAVLSWMLCVNITNVCPLALAGKPQQVRRHRQ